MENYEVACDIRVNAETGELARSMRIQQVGTNNVYKQLEIKEADWDKIASKIFSVECDEESDTLTILDTQGREWFLYFWVADGAGAFVDFYPARLDGEYKTRPMYRIFGGLLYQAFGSPR
jgi:hypothetical protein